MNTHIPLAEHELRAVLAAIRTRVVEGHTSLTRDIPTAATEVAARLRALGFGVFWDHYNGLMLVDWSDR